MHMPTMDGITATRTWRAEEDSNNSIPIIALTANISEDDRLACLQAGMNEFLSKPVSAERLFNVLENFTSKSASPTPLTS
jgi:CheY-like chemotaxis protein